MEMAFVSFAVGVRHYFYSWSASVVMHLGAARY